MNGENTFYAKGFKADDWVKNKALAITLERIAKNGSAGFYEGINANAIIKRIKETGGVMTAEDLLAYKPVWRDPVHFKYEDLDLYAMAPPSSGGICLGQIMKMIEPSNIGQYAQNSLEAMQIIIEAERRSYADRSLYLGDPDFINIPQDSLLDKAYLSDRMLSFSFDQASRSLDINPGNIIWEESEETTHYSILDPMGNAVAVTTTLNGSYGSKVFVESGGYFLNNEMDDFSSKPGVPNMFGLIGGKANAIAPEKRMLSAMTPTIVMKNKKPHLILGSPGGPSIITSVFQTILNVIEYEMNVNDAVSSPRFHHQWYPDLIVMEKEAYSNELDSILKGKNYLIVKLPIQEETLGVYKRSDIGAVDAILINDNGRVFGGADLRREHHSSTID